MTEGTPHSEINQSLLKVIRLLVGTVILLVFALIVVGTISIFKPDVSSWFKKSNESIAREAEKKKAFEEWSAANQAKLESATFWHAPELNEFKGDSLKLKQLKYGKELIAHTAKYLGPKGSVMQITNGMNCQNCHLDAGTKPWGNNYASVFSTYPKYRARSGQVENIYKRINDCMERSLNGKALPESGKEMQAIKSYIEYIGSKVPKGSKAKGSGIFELDYLNRAADPSMGAKLYENKCQSCHQPNGEGLMAADQVEYTYPPLWGQHSYNQGAGLFRISRFAGYIKYNMPQGATYEKPQLTDEEAWDIAAFVNSQPRPNKDISKDWPKIEEKPIDHPFGLFSDPYPEQQHKYGPFKPISDYKKKEKENQSKTKS
ncbi:MAG: c-type cytochrome [Chitinophagaceae bacterium]|nr:c-type cytochrome [Chitinophagaceae bacterium]